MACLVFFAIAGALLVVPAPSDALSFNFSSFDQSLQCNDWTTKYCINLQGKAVPNMADVYLNDDTHGSNMWSVGRVVYGEPLLLWDKETDKLTDFTTHFSFKIISPPSKNSSADGMTFFLSPYPYVEPQNAFGCCLGLFNLDSINNCLNHSGIVAVEFDTYKNYWDPVYSHVGIDINSIESVTNVAWNTPFSSTNVWVSYNATTHNLSVLFSNEDNPVFTGNSSLHWIVDLQKILPEKVAIGFSASTGNLTELHKLFSWSFSSTLEPKKKSKFRLIEGLATAAGLLAVIGVFLWFFLWRKNNALSDRDEEALDPSMDYEFEQGRGPKRFLYKELATSTKNFSKEGKLGEGGFGAVYRGFLKDHGVEVAIKRISKGSKQGKKEYISEVKIIRRLRHRNLVQLVGWCHNHDDLLLVYEFMPNGSLDKHLYCTEKLLTWPQRYKIGLGLASSLLYLHEEWEQCVVHRDVKPSNDA